MNSKSYEKRHGMNFSEALGELKAGERVARPGWNGKGMWLILIPGSTVTVRGRPLASGFDVGSVIKYLPHIDMKAVDGSVVPWVASQTDILAEDWEIV